MKKVRKSFRNFILSRIAKSHKDQEFLDVSLMTTDGEMVEAHKFVLAAFWSQSFTSLMADLRQGINRVASFSGCLNGTFP